MLFLCFHSYCFLSPPDLPCPSPPGLLGSMGDSAPLQLLFWSVFSSHFTFLKFLKKENQKYNPALTMTALIYYY